MAGRQRKPNTLRVLVLKRNFRQYKNSLAIEQPEEFRKQLQQQQEDKQREVQHHQRPNKRMKIICENKEVAKDLNSSNLSVKDFVRSSQQLLKDLNDSIASVESARVPCYKHFLTFFVRKFR